MYDTVPMFNSCTKCTTTRPIAIQFLGHGCMDDLTTGRSFESLATWVIDVLGLLLFLTRIPWLFVQPVTDRSLVNWCRS